MIVNNTMALEKAEKKENLTFSQFMNTEKAEEIILRTIPAEEKQSFATSIITAVGTNPNLQACDKLSILTSALLGHSLKLCPSPQLGQYYLVPYKEKKDGKVVRIVAQFQIGYKGLIQLAIRTGFYKKIIVLDVREGELIKWDPLTEVIQVNLIEDDDIRENKAVIGYYTFYESVKGFRKALYWSKQRMERHARKYSDLYREYNKGKWVDEFDLMALKTMLKQLLSKWGMLSDSPEGQLLQKAIESDMAVIEEDGSKIYVDNLNEENETEKTEIAEAKATELKQEKTQTQPEAQKQGNTALNYDNDLISIFQ